MPELHPTGTFEAEVLDHGFDFTSKNGALYFWADFQTEEGQVPGRFMLTGGAIPYSLRKIYYMGYRGKTLERLQEGDLLTGKAVQITVEHEEFEGKRRALVGFVNPPGSTAPGRSHNPEAATKAAGLDAAWAKIRAELEGADEDDIPF